ncbi:sugar porter family MFS transporter [Lentilactobacillus diolivorans]|mgnify:CR=1 FL=1|uniref:sugar porter family MFS transporter n=1 Tax=Lentilactobacillus diolivorans TaxID=179838 RepID=UPI0024699F93|nr:sugar porter family MFS transporter [Lentilactobacillus diolivorans]MDH5104532.1 sugar porter family MFS transporter [Lentilactobacillus diolivorans]
MDQENTKNATGGSLKYVIVIVLIAAIGGSLFGYDQGVVSGALSFFSVHFKMSQAEVGFVSGVLALGAMVGCLIAGWMSDHVGRKPVMITAGALFTLSSLLLAFSPTVKFLIAGRILSGIAIGMASTIVPLYISEVAPAKIRGTLVSANQLAFAIGMTAVYIVNACIANLNASSWNISYGWRFMFGSGVVPAIIFFVLTPFIPESPRFLFRRNKADKAVGILQRLNGVEVARKEAVAISQEMAHENKGLLKELFKPGVRFALMIALLAAAFQQLTGTIAVGYYAPVIFQKTGVGTNASLIETIGIGIVKIIFVAIFMVYIDKLGRKKLLTWGAFAMAVALFALGIFFSVGKFDMLINILIMIGVFAHTAFYELSWGGGAWVIMSEVFPTSIRGRAQSLSSLTMFLASYFVSQGFPIMLDDLGATWTFTIFAVFCLVMMWFASKVLPETNGKTLEQIQADFTKNHGKEGLRHEDSKIKN